MTHKPGRLTLWAHILVRGLQTVFAATTRRLEQVDQRLMQEAAEKESQATGSEGGPPAHWLSKVRGGGPPAHWLEDIRRRAADQDSLETFDVTVQSPEPERMSPFEARAEDSSSAMTPAEAPASENEAPRKKTPAEASASKTEVRSERSNGVRMPVTTSASRTQVRSEESRGERVPVTTSASKTEVRGEGSSSVKAPAKASASRFGRFIQPIVAVRRAELPQAKAPEKTRSAMTPGAQAITARSQPPPTYNQPDMARRDTTERPPLSWPALPDGPHRRAPIAEPEQARLIFNGSNVQEPQRAAPEQRMSHIPPGAVLLRGEHAPTPHVDGSESRPPAPNVWPELPPDNWPVADDDAIAQREHLQQLQREQEGSR